ncbi:hypothetical protein V6C42_00655 [Pseudoclostridium thermosuccinogenes]|uniref:hypothetical protein n=1 Tax=Clostridium thermosuccinogenes TaxID=84032 RepID=UPI00137473CE|nr:hypothetical protein [Pseudoclostridium thermosuccinogenes]
MLATQQIKEKAHCIRQHVILHGREDGETIMGIDSAKAMTAKGKQTFSNGRWMIAGK